MKHLYLFPLFFCMLSLVHLYAENPVPNNSHWGFIENRGQFTTPKGEPLPQVKYVTDRPGMRFILRPDGFSYEWQKIEGEMPTYKDKHDIESITSPTQDKPQSQTTYRVDVKLIGANPAAEIQGIAANSDYINYYNTPQHPEGILQVPNYSKVIYRNIYPHIDWVLYSKADGSLKYDFIIHPGGNPSDIQLQYEGASELHLTQAGNLSITSPLGETQEEAPLSLQSNRTIPSRYILSDNRLRFEIGSYNRTQDLIIDPSLRIWATYYGGVGVDDGNTVVTDVNSNVYIAGTTNSTNNISFNGYQNTCGAASNDAFVVKFDSAGTRLWATYYGDIGIDKGFSVAADANGNVYLAGTSASTSNIAFNGHQNTYGGNWDLFLVKFNSSCTRLWATYYGGSGVENYETSLATDTNGNIYLAGNTLSTSNIAFNGHQNTFGGGDYDAFLVKFNTGGTPLWATYYGGINKERVNSIATDVNGNIYITGETESPNDIAFNGHQDTLAGTLDAFLVKFNSSGTRLWATYYGGNSDEMSYSVATDVNGNVYIAGETRSTTNIAFNGYQNTFGGGWNDLFLVNFNSSGIRLWATYYGGDEREDGGGVAVDANGCVYLAGYTESTNNIAFNGHQNTHGGGYSDVFLVKFDPNCTRLWATYYGGNEIEWQFSVTTDPDGNAYLLGITKSLNNISFNGHQNTYDGGAGGANWDAFLVKFKSGCKMLYNVDATSSDTVGCNNMSIQLTLQNLPANYQTIQWSPITGLDNANIANPILTVDSAVSTTYSAVVTVNNYAGCSAESDTLHFTFTQPTVNLIGPNFITGNSYPVTWGGFLPTANITLSVSNDGGNIWTPVLTNQAPSGSDTIILPITMAAGTWILKAEDINKGCSQTQTFTTITVSILDAQTESSFIVYPNPTEDRLYIRPKTQAENSHLEANIYDLTGRLLLTQFEPHAINGTSLSLKDIPPGVYLLQLITDKGNTTQRICVEK